MIRFACAFLGLIACTALAAADDAAPAKKKPNPEKLFKKLDTNGDGKLSKEEFLKMAELHGGKSSPGKGKGQRLEKLFQKLDADNDGYLTMDEFKKLSQLREEFKKKKNKTE